MYLVPILATRLRYLHGCNFGIQMALLALLVNVAKDKYFLQFEQIHLEIWTNTFSNLNKYIQQFKKILCLQFSEKGESGSCSDEIKVGYGSREAILQFVVKSKRR